MEYFVVCSAAVVASGLTLFSGFGLGTLLLPAFLIFFPADIAVAMTAIVHLLNNLFKLVLLGRHAVAGVVLRFGLPAVVAAYAGSMVLATLSGHGPLFTYQISGHTFAIMPVNLVMAALILVFAVAEVAPAFQHLSFDRKYLPVGGILSGFFGGLSGHQGALRSAFLVRSGLTQEAFIATGIVIACLVDVTRLAVYTEHFSAEQMGVQTGILVAATASAFCGVVIGTRLMSKVTMTAVQRVVSALLAFVAVGLGTGLL